jgi:hypothetical protein
VVRVTVAARHAIRSVYDERDASVYDERDASAYDERDADGDGSDYDVAAASYAAHRAM